MGSKGTTPNGRQAAHGTGTYNWKRRAGRAARTTVANAPPPGHHHHVRTSEVQVCERLFVFAIELRGE